MEFGDDTAEETTGKVEKISSRRSRFVTPLTDENRSMLYSMMAALIEGGLSLEQAAGHVSKEANSRMSAAAEIFFGQLSEIRTLDGTERSTRMDSIISEAFGRRHVETEEHVLLAAMAIAPVLTPLLKAASMIALRSSDSRRGSEDNIETIRKQA